MDEKIKQLVAVVGEKAVSEKAEDLRDFASDLSVTGSKAPKAIVKATSADEVHKIVQWANETSTPLIPVSSGPPRFRGDTVPDTDGNIIVDLSGMKRIVHLDSKNRMIIVEPGITYTELKPLLEKENLSLSMPLLPRRNKSVIASLLEREPVTLPKYRWLFCDPLRCLELVWGNGHKMMTGEAGFFHSIESAWKRDMVQLKPFGPAQMDYFKFVQAAQGTMGIVTWASLRCERLPKVQKSFFIPSDNLEALIEFAYKVLRIRFGDEFLLLNNADLANILGKNPEEITAYKGKLPEYVLFLNIAGRDMFAEERVDFVEKDISDIAQEYSLKLDSEVAGVSASDMLGIITNPSDEPYWKLRLNGGCEDIFFITQLEKTVKFIETMSSTAQSMGYPVSDIGIYIQPTHQGASCHCEFDLPYDPNSTDEASRVRQLVSEASKRLMEQGAFFSRPYGIWADMVYAPDSQTTRMLNVVKDIFDPKRIMNPGKLCFK